MAATSGDCKGMDIERRTFQSMADFLKRSTVFALAVVYGCSAAPVQPPVSASLRTARSALRLGSVSLHRCLGGDYYCGDIRVALDPAGQVPGKIDIAFAWLPHTNQRTRSSGTIVAVEGGPGYPSIGSLTLYRALYRPLLDTREMLLVDNRGTGKSDPVICRPLQRGAIMRLQEVTRCGRQLGPSSDLYGTALAADDLAAVLSALGLGKVDIYGDSYGSFFVQAFAGRHPERVRTVVLDGAYQVIGGNPWYPNTTPTIHRAFDDACSRSPVCATLGGSSLQRIERLLHALRVERSHITPTGIAFVMDTAGLDPLAYRDLDAAARAYLDGHDVAPLERLVDEAYSQEEGAGGGARGYSQGLFAAASCSDNPQAYDMRSEPPERVAAWHQALERKRDEDPTIYSPFTLNEYLGIPIDYSYLPLCVTWPVASKKHLAGEPVPPRTRFPKVPVLVLNGDLDTITTPAEGAHAARLFPHANHVIVANSGHVTALSDYYGCASGIVRHFTQSGVVDAECASEVPALHLVPSFSRTVSEVAPAMPLSGNRAPVRELRAAAAAVLSAADVLTRSYQFVLSSGTGLRGGTYSATPSNAADTATLFDIHWTSDLAVSGSAELDARSARAHAQVTLAGASTGVLAAEWPTAGSDASAILEGTADGYYLHAKMPAP